MPGHVPQPWSRCTLDRVHAAPNPIFLKWPSSCGLTPSWRVTFPEDDGAHTGWRGLPSWCTLGQCYCFFFLWRPKKKENILRERCFPSRVAEVVLRGLNSYTSVSDYAGRLKQNRVYRVRNTNHDTGVTMTVDIFTSPLPERRPGQHEGGWSGGKTWN